MNPMHNLKPKKRLGQHFLRDLGTARRIVQSLGAAASDPVVEIGPGEGVLTGFLIEAYSRLTLVEVDHDAVAYLCARFPRDAFRLVHMDVLAWPMKTALEPESFLIGNLPYNISSPFFFHLLDARERVRAGVFMVQKEVAARICSPPGSKAYGILSVLLGAYFDLAYEFSVAPGAFRPPPKVQSGVFSLCRKAEAPDVSFPALLRLVKLAFGQRRKMLRNALSSLGLPEEPETAAFFSLRAEQIAVADFIRLARRWEDRLIAAPSVPGEEGKD
jgi:16S rRNA (adenine1518-N6/adenine1519-N6)-dimethyltransferase